MNIDQVEACLTNCLGNSPEFVVEQVNKLLKQIKEDKRNEPDSDSIQKDFAVLNNYTTMYKNLVGEKTYIFKDLTLKEKVKSVQEILMLLSCVDNYLAGIINRKEVKNLSSTNNDGSYLRTLLSEKERYKSERFVYQEMLKSLTSEVQGNTAEIRFQTEKLKLQS